MLDWTVLALSLAYLALLFLIAWFGDRRARGRPVDRAPMVYALSIGVYCTSWTLFGAVGVAAESGLNYLAIYIGPILIFGLGWRLIARMIRIARAENVVSISDFISARYGKSRALAVLVTLAAVLGLLPYFALQLKAITISFEALSGDAAADAAGRLPGGTTLIVAVAMAAFAVLFGVRSVNANEHHRGLMLAVAAESVVKILAALLVGGAITFFALQGPGDIIARASADPQLTGLIDFDMTDPVWWATVLLATLAFLCLPRQFHVAVVENTHVDDVRAASWGFPAYLVAINLFVLPVAIVGLTLFPAGGVQPDSFLVAIPRELDWTWLAFVAFIGGLSAATGMIIVATLALGTMVSNDVVLPLLATSRRFRARWQSNPGPVLLMARRFAVIGLMAAAYLVYLGIGSAFPLAQIGMISFVAVAQFAPALLGGMFWRRATGVGAFAAIGAGFLGWLWTVAVPSFATAGWLPETLTADGPFGIVALRPGDIAGLGLDPLINGMLWSLGPNVLLFFAVSLVTRPSLAERWQAERFVTMRAANPGWQGTARTASLADLHELAARFVGRERADAAFRALAEARPDSTSADEAMLPARHDAEAVQVTERLLAGAIGSASARVVVASLLADSRVSRSDARELIDAASRAILSRHEVMQDALQTIRQGLCAFDENLRVTLWNRRFVELLDLPADMLRVGTSLAEIVEFNEARGEYGRNREFQTLLARLTDPARQGKSDLYERRRPDGTVLEIATNPMPSGGSVTVYTDVTERHAAAGALREANEALEARVAERTLALSDAKAEAERANLGKTRFLAAAGHDLMQPLQAARLFLSALSERIADPAVARIDASLDSVEHLLGELVEVSKLDSGVTKPSFSDFRIADVLGPLREEFSLLARQHGLEFRAVSSSASVHSDPALLRRILQNLLANAVRYTGEGRVLIGCRRRGAMLSIEVWDSGPGIPEDRFPELFMEFFRLGHDDRGRGQGLGLGLAIVERLAGMMDHPVGVRSTPGKGSSFTIQVPLAAAPAAAVVPISQAHTRRFRGALVLFIENEAAIAAAMVDLLAGWSCEVIAAATPEEGLERLAGRRPDVILSDYHLDHGMIGLDAIAVLRAALSPAPPAALITADRDAGLRADAAAVGCRILHKPVRPGALRALLAQLLTERAERAAE